MKLNYRKDGQTHSIDLSTEKPVGKSLAVHHSGTNYYAPLVPADDANASALRIRVGGEVLAVSKGSTGGALAYNADRTAVTLTDDFEGDLLVWDYAASVVTIVAAEGANNGEPIYIQGNDNGNVFYPNSNGGTIDGGDGNDIFVCNGGDVTIQNYSVGDQISLLSGNEFAGGWMRDDDTSRVTVYTGGGTIVFDTLSADDNVTIWQNGAATQQKFGKWADFASKTPKNSMAVTLLSAYGDFGVQGDSLDSGYTVTGGGDSAVEYFDKMFTIEATQANSTIIGNQLGNTIYVKGGDRNVITGGIGGNAMTGACIFQNNSGGVFTDFGVGTTGHAGYASVSGYDRNDPTSYNEGSDKIQVYGTVLEVYAGDKDANGETFTAYVTYRGTDNQFHYIALCNITKKLLSDGITYQTNETAAKNLRIWDTNDSTNPALIGSTALKQLLKYTTNRNAAYKAGCDALDALMVARAIKLGLKAKDGNDLVVGVSTIDDIPPTNFIAGADGKNKTKSTS